MVRLNALAKDIHIESLSKGWWKTNRSFAEVIALCHSELSEALEEWRDGKEMAGIYYSSTGKPEGVGIELADAIIRILDACVAYGIDIEEAIKVKMAYNATRPYRHGDKLG